VAGPFWYAAGATVQILMFSILACKVKQNAPRCHTYLEIIYARYGAVAHLVFMLFAFVTNILVGSQLLLGGSAVVTSLTGMNVYAAIFLIPTGMSERLGENYILLTIRCLRIRDFWAGCAQLSSATIHIR
jgi:Na+/proline symporter